METECQEILYKEKSNALQKICKVLPYVSENLSQLIQRRLKDLSLSKSAIAQRVGVSRAYIGDLANQTAKTQNGSYRPSPAIVEKLARVLEVSQSEILNAIGYETESEEIEIPESVKEAFAFEGHLSPNDEILIAGIIKQLKENNKEKK